MTSVIPPTTANILSQSHQQMLVASQQINMSLNVAGDISRAAASLCSHWFFSTCSLWQVLEHKLYYGSLETVLKAPRLIQSFQTSFFEK